MCVLSGVQGGGSLRLVMSNDYYLSENIILNFNPNYYYFPTKKQQTSIVSLDLKKEVLNKNIFIQFDKIMVLMI